MPVPQGRAAVGVDIASERVIEEREQRRVRRQPVGTVRDRDGPLRVGAQGQAGDAQDGGLLLHAAGVGDHGARPAHEPHEVEVAERLDDMHARVVVEPEGLEHGPATRMQREHDVGAGRRGVQEGDELARGLRVVDVAGSMKRRDEVVAGQSQLLAHPDRIEAVEVGQECVDHGVADEMDALGGHALAGEVRDRIGARAQQEIGEAVGDDPVDLLRHRHVEGAQSGFDVCDRDAELARGDGCGEGGVDVAVDDDQLGTSGQHLGFEAHEERCGLLSVASRADTEVDVGPRQVELAEEHLRHAVVVVLARVHQALPGTASGQGSDHGSRLGEVGTGPGDVQQGHRGLPVAGAASRLRGSRAVTPSSPPSSIPDREVGMRRLGFVRRVPLAATGALRRFAADPARGRAALERAVPRLRRDEPDDPVALVDRAVAQDRYDDALRALDLVPPGTAERTSCELAVDVLSGHLVLAAGTRPADARGRRAVRAARRQLQLLGQPVGAPAVRPRARAADGRLGVLHVVTNSLPLTQAGSTIRTQRIARAQRDVGWDAHVVTRPGYPVTHGDLTSPDPQVVDGVPYHRLLPMVMPADERMREEYAALLGQLVDRIGPGVLHAASDHVNAAVALEVGRARGLPVAYEARSFFEDTWLARHGGEAARDSDTYALLRDRHTEALLAADAVTTLSESMREAIIARGVAAERVFVVPNAVPLEFLEPRDAGAARRALGIEEAFWVGSVATVNDDEGFDTLVDAVALLRGEGLDARMLVVGDGPGLASLRVRAASSGVPLLSPGRVPVAQVRQWFDALDVFALPRADTALNRGVTALKPLEAQARGIPVVGSDLPAVAEVLAPGSRLVPAGDPRALAEAVHALVDPVERGQAGAQARAWVEATRTWPSVMGGYRAAYSFLGALTG